MKRIKLILLFTLLVNISSAQVVNFENVTLETKNSIQASFSVDLAALINIEYGRVISIKNNPFILSANVGLPFGEIISDDYKIVMNISGNISKRKNWTLPAHIGLFNNRTKNSMNSVASSGFRLSITPGYYKKSWFVASEIAYEKFLLTHIENSEFYKKVYYAEAKDGWYKNSGGNIHFGIITGKTINKGELNLKFGLQTTENLNQVLVPYYVQIGYKHWF